MQKPSQAEGSQHLHLKHVVLSESEHISIYFSTVVDLRGDTFFPVDYGNGRVDPSRPIFSSLSIFLLASLCCMARLTPCYHGNKDWCGMARTTERGRRGRKGRKSPPSVLCQQQKPRGNLVGETESQEFIPNFLTHTNRFVLQHQHWQVLLSFPLLSKSSVPLSYPPLLPFPCTLSTLQSLLVQPCLPLFSYSPLPLCDCTSLLSFSIPGNELIMTLVWFTVVKQKCNYKNVTSGYTKRMREKSLLFATSVLCWRRKRKELILLDFIYRVISISLLCNYKA